MTDTAPRYVDPATRAPLATHTELVEAFERTEGLDLTTVEDAALLEHLAARTP